MKEIILPSINGVKSILQACNLPGSKVRRLVVTSSFASVIDVHRNPPPGPDFTYTADHWNPLTYEEAVHPQTSPVVAYRGGKKFAELEAWDFVAREKPAFDLVTLCPPLVFGPIVHPLSDISQLNESNTTLQKVAKGADPLPEARVAAWVNVKDLAEAHVQALLKPEAGGKRYIPASPQPFTYELAADIIKDEFPWAQDTVTKNYTPGRDPLSKYKLDGIKITEELGVKYSPFRQTVIDLIKQLKEFQPSS
jgi:nucleoside-diphosphate-sugar epimerase